MSASNDVSFLYNHDDTFFEPVLAFDLHDSTLAVITNRRTVLDTTDPYLKTNK